LRLLFEDVEEFGDFEWIQLVHFQNGCRLCFQIVKGFKGVYPVLYGSFVYAAFLHDDFCEVSVADLVLVAFFDYLSYDFLAGLFGFHSLSQPVDAHGGSSSQSQMLQSAAMKQTASNSRVKSYATPQLTTI